MGGAVACMSYTVKTIELFLIGVLLDAYAQFPTQKEGGDITVSDVVLPTCFVDAVINGGFANLELVLNALY